MPRFMVHQMDLVHGCLEKSFAIVEAESATAVERVLNKYNGAQYCYRASLCPPQFMTIEQLEVTMEALLRRDSMVALDTNKVADQIDAIIKGLAEVDNLQKHNAEETKEE